MDLKIWSRTFNFPQECSRNTSSRKWVGDLRVELTGETHAVPLLHIPCAPRGCLQSLVEDWVYEQQRGASAALVETPEVLSVQLLRCRAADVHGPRKLQHRIVPSTRPSVPQFAHDDTQQTEYHLCSGVYHIGHSSKMGHYRAFGYGKPNDSAQVTQDLVSLQSHMQHGAVHPALYVHDDNRIGATADVTEIEDICCNWCLLFLSACAVVRC